MAKQYSEVFKRNCVQKHKDLIAKGIIVINKIEVKNVRELIKALGVSNDSLYKWVKLYPLEKEGNNDISDDFFDSGSIEISKSSGGKKGDDDLFMKLDNTFFMSLARGLGIKNYRLAEKQLWLAVGTELIKRSGLIDNHKVRKELRIN